MMESNSVPTKMAVAAFGTVVTPAFCRMPLTPFHDFDASPFWARWIL